MKLRIVEEKNMQKNMMIIMKKDTSLKEMFLKTKNIEIDLNNCLL